jgi:hypothetical protein
MTTFFELKAANKKEAFTLAYNLVDGLDRYRWRCDSALLLEIIRGRLHEDAHSYLLKIRRTLIGSVIVAIWLFSVLGKAFALRFIR